MRKIFRITHVWNISDWWGKFFLCKCQFFQLIFTRSHFYNALYFCIKWDKCMKMAWTTIFTDFLMSCYFFLLCPGKLPEENFFATFQYDFFISLRKNCLGKNILLFFIAIFLPLPRNCSGKNYSAVFHSELFIFSHKVSQEKVILLFLLRILHFLSKNYPGKDNFPFFYYKFFIFSQRIAQEKITLPLSNANFRFSLKNCPKMDHFAIFLCDFFISS